MSRTCRAATTDELRPYEPMLWFALPVLLLALLVAFPPHAFDTAVSSLFFDAGAWPLHKSWVLSQIFHKGAKAVPIVFALVLLISLARRAVGMLRGRED